MADQQILIPRPQGVLPGRASGMYFPSGQDVLGRPIQSGLEAIVRGLGLDQTFPTLLGQGQVPQAPQAPAPAPQPAQQMPVSMKLGWGGSMGTPQSYSFSTPLFVDPNAIQGQQPNLPSAPVYTPPTAPEEDPNAKWDSIFQGLAAGLANIDPMMSNGDQLLRLGLSALAGQAAGRKEQRQEKKDFQQKMDDFNQRKTQADFENQISLTNAQNQFQNQQVEKLMTLQNAVKPQISGDTVVMPSISNGKINYTVKSNPNSSVNAKLGLATGAAAADITQIFDALLLHDPAIVEAAAKESGVGTQMMRGAGLGERTVDTASKAKIMGIIKTKSPQLYQQAQILAQQQALIKALQ